MTSNNNIRPPRPKAIATFLSSRDFLPGCQTLLHSVRTKLPPTTGQDQYPPELIVLLSSKLKNDESVIDRLRFFCDRIIEVEHIPIYRNSDDGAASHVKAWDENCGWTKLRLFELEGYSTILYIDADCLVVKDVSHLLSIDESDGNNADNTDQTTTHRRGLLAAAPDIFPPDKFNAGVMVLRPSKEVFLDMMSCLPHRASTVDNHDTDARKCTSYDGGDTGFLNCYYPGWHSSWPSYSRLQFGYNAQRIMFHYTKKRPQYWDEGIDNLYIVHYSSSPKPWETMSSSSPVAADCLDGQDKNAISLTGGKLENMWKAAYERSQNHFMKEKRKQLTSSAQSTSSDQTKGNQSARKSEQATTSSRSSPARSNANLFNKRFKQLRDSGMSMSEAMAKARAEYGLDKMDNVDPRKAVGQMFGLR